MIERHKIAFLLLLVSPWTVAAGLSAAQDWAHWRGTTRNDVVAEDSGFRDGDWPPGEPAWTANVDEGSSSPLVVDSRVYCLGWRDDQDSLRCLDARGGNELWRQSYPCARYGRQATGDEGVYSGPSATPEFDTASGLLFTLSIDGHLNCWDTAREGQRVWGLNLYENYDVARRPRHGRSGLRDYGYTSSPFVHEDWVLVEVGDDEGTVMAFGKQTGERVWASECHDPAGHTGGMAPLTVEGKPCLAAMTYEGLLVLSLDPARPGKTVAKYKWTTNFANNIASPAVQGNSVLITSDYNHGAICRLEITPGHARKVWEQPVSSKVCSPLVFQGHVYWAWRQVHCLDFETGEPRWSGGDFGDAGSCIATQDARLIVWGKNGKLALVETAATSPDEYHELALRDNVFTTDAWPHVVLAHGRLYCKDREGNLKCFVVGQTTP